MTGRPPLPFDKATLNVYLDKADYEKVKLIAAEDRCSMAEVVRRAVKLFLESA